MKSRILAAVLWLLACTFTASAQVSINGSLRGRISDPGNAALAGATITLGNAAIATTLTTTSDGNGEYLFARVAPGLYVLTIEKDGFKRAQREGLTITVNEAAVVNATLEVGGVNETVTVKADAQVVQSQTANLSARRLFPSLSVSWPLPARRLGEFTRECHRTR